jgi:hypothetical protein
VKKRKKKAATSKHAATAPSRPVDEAMRSDRPAKTAIRRKWLEVLREVVTHEPPRPVYLTLAGAEGKDVQLLIDENLISLTETGAIAEESANFCVAVESSLPAVAELQRRYPGLRILRQNIQGVLRGESLLSYPGGDDRLNCQAHVVNLDLQATLDGQIANGDAPFPILRWIEKFGTLHLECPFRDWHLLLTLNASVQWPDDVCRWVCDFLRENFATVTEFRARAAQILDPEIFQTIENGGSVSFGTLHLSLRQRLLLVLIPKAIGNYLCSQGWDLTTQFSAEYSGTGDAPMVTYIFALKRGTGGTRANAYRRAVSQCLTTVQRITPEGTLKDL